MPGAPAPHAIHQSQTPAFSKHFFSRLTRFFFPCPIIPLPPQELHSPAGSSLSPQIKRTACVRCVLSGIWLVLASQQAVRREPWGGGGHVASRANPVQPDLTPLTPSHPGPAESPVYPSHPSKFERKHKCAHTNEFLLMRDAKELHKYDDISTDLWKKKTHRHKNTHKSKTKEPISLG